jgi:hypothetical protein
MFSMFRKPPSEAESIAICGDLARGADITLVLEAGEPKTLLINIGKTGASVVDYFKFQEAVSAFCNSIEARISSGDFDGADWNRDVPSEIAAMSRPLSQAQRLVISSEFKKLFTWFV